MSYVQEFFPGKSGKGLKTQHSDETQETKKGRKVRRFKNP